jgi:hypothetical protein
MDFVMGMPRQGDGPSPRGVGLRPRLAVMPMRRRRHLNNLAGAETISIASTALTVGNIVIMMTVDLLKGGICQ